MTARRRVEYPLLAVLGAIVYDGAGGEKKKAQRCVSVTDEQRTCNDGDGDEYKF